MLCKVFEFFLTPLLFVVFLDLDGAGDALVVELDGLMRAPSTLTDPALTLAERLNAITEIESRYARLVERYSNNQRVS